MSQVQIQIVTWNSKPHLPRLFAGIRKQNDIDYTVLVIDNNSQDDTREWLKVNAPEAGIIANQVNFGFAKAHNQGFAVCDAPFALVLNPDTELQANFLKNLLPLFENEAVASAGGKLYLRLPELKKYGILDSRGLKMNLLGKVSDRGHGEQDKGQYQKKEEVFGISGACVIYRLSALYKVKDKWGIFDERFGSYKEDADLAWRLNKRGFKAIVTDSARAIHPRGVNSNNRRRIPTEIKIASRRNHLLMLRKNLTWRDWWRMPLIAGYELAKFIYTVLFEREILNAYQEAISHKP